MLGELYYLFCKYGEQIAEKYNYTECFLQFNFDGSGTLRGFKATIVASGCPPIWHNALSVAILSWTTLDEAVNLFRKEVVEILESGGKS